MPAAMDGIWCWRKNWTAVIAHALWQGSFLASCIYAPEPIMISFDEAIARVVEHAHPLDREEVSLDQAHRRILSDSVSAGLPAPASDVSAMDGIAVRDADLSLAPATLRIIGASFAGEPWAGAIRPGECVRVFTGAALPTGADRVIMQEHVRFSEDRATVMEGYGPGWHVRAAGSDFAAGESLVPAGIRLGPRHLLCAAAADRATVSVWRKPRVGILGTGTELVPAGSAAGISNRLPDSVSHGVAALVDIWGGEVVERRLAGDDLTELRSIAGAMLERADVTVVTGGASVGERDHGKEVFAPYGLDLLFSKVALKPGKPVWIGRCGEKYVVGLPGNPTSAMVTARLLLAPLLAALVGRPWRAALAWRRLVIVGELKPDPMREHFPRARMEGDLAVLLTCQDSGLQKPLAPADLLVRASTVQTVDDGRPLGLCLDF